MIRVREKNEDRSNDDEGTLSVLFLYYSAILRMKSFVWIKRCYLFRFIQKPKTTRMVAKTTTRRTTTKDTMSRMKAALPGFFSTFMAIDMLPCMASSSSGSFPSIAFRLEGRGEAISSFTLLDRVMA